MENFYLLNYSLDYCGVGLCFSNGQEGYVQFNDYSGRLVERPKKAVLTTVSHSGVYLGQDYRGGNWYIHNHPVRGEACIVSEREFSQDKHVSLTPVACQNPPNIVIERSLEHVKRRTPYNLLNSNCQHLTSDSCNSLAVSHDLEKWKNIAANTAKGAAAGAGVSLLIILLNKLFSRSN